ncbi:hypothetical protein [Salinicola sp. DM10]|uniref:hypothetical protein n=1 Tax=Salinicola sp. DM10 TaxID=2815721 RepID=UPI001A900575|nr:hypothetical protein [Salinicola sp. DM10]MCE3028592.1 hypothetical protein [Salinicola sp. DM10]
MDSKENKETMKLSLSKTRQIHIQEHTAIKSVLIVAASANVTAYIYAFIYWHTLGIELPRFGSITQAFDIAGGNIVFYVFLNGLFFLSAIASKIEGLWPRLEGKIEKKQAIVSRILVYSPFFAAPLFYITQLKIDNPTLSSTIAHPFAASLIMTCPAIYLKLEEKIDIKDKATLFVGVTALVTGFYFCLAFPVGEAKKDLREPKGTLQTIDGRNYYLINRVQDYNMVLAKPGDDKIIVIPSPQVARIIYDVNRFKQD